MPLLTPPPAAPQRGDRTTFANRVDAFITWLINFVTELVALVSNLNSIAAGGAYAIPYTFAGNAVSNGSAKGGVMAYGGGSQLLVDTIGSDGKSVAGMLSSLLTVSSAVKGHLRLIKIGDPSKWVVYSINSYAPNGGGLYGILSVGLVDHSPDYSFAGGDSVLAYIQLTGDKGDKGDKGDSAVTQIIRVRDERASGTSGGTSTASSWNVRTINAVVANNMTGAYLSGNYVVLPAGTFRFAGSVPAGGVGTHMAQLYNATDNVLVESGTSEFCGTGSTVGNRSLLRGQFTIPAAKSFYIRQWASAAGPLGTPVSAGTPEVYSEIQFEKVG